MRTSALAVAACCAVTAIVTVSVFMVPKEKPAALPVSPPTVVTVYDTRSAESPGVLAPITVKDPASNGVLPSIPEKKQADNLVKTAELRNYIQQQVETPVQKVLLAGDADTIISFSNGTKISVAPGAFVNERTGLPVTGPVEIKVKEFYDLNAMMMAHLTTSTSDGMLETNGMIYINASASGEACRLRNGEAMQVSFPIKNNKPGMELFSGEKDASGAIIWKPLKINASVINGNMSSAAKKQLPQTDSVSIPIDTTLNSLPEFPGGIKSIARNINSTSNYFPFNGPAGPVLVDIVISKKGNVRWVKKILSCSNEYFDCMARALYKMPLWKPAYKKGKAVVYTMRMMVLFNPRTEKVLHFFPCYRSPNQIQERVIEEYYREYPMPEYTVEKYYSFATSKLGWINCDRFYKEPGPKTQLFVQAPTSDAMDVKMIFHNYRSIVAAGSVGGKYSFYNVPLGEPVTIIALKGTENHLQMAVKNINISNDPVTGLDFKNVTPESIKATMEQFNSLFQSTAMK